jgi:fructose-bisphosphate aldolase class II
MLESYAGVLKVDGGVGDKKAYDPRVWGRKGEASMAARVGRACEELGSAGRSIAG